MLAQLELRRNLHQDPRKLPIFIQRQCTRLGIDMFLPWQTPALDGLTATDARVAA